MNPSIDFHHITRIGLTDIRVIVPELPEQPFAVRDLVITGPDGEYRIGLFAHDEETLRLDSELLADLLPEPLTH